MHDAPKFRPIIITPPDINDRSVHFVDYSDMVSSSLPYNGGFLEESIRMLESVTLRIRTRVTCSVVFFKDL